MSPVKQSAVALSPRVNTWILILDDRPGSLQRSNRPVVGGESGVHTETNKGKLLHGRCYLKQLLGTDGLTNLEESSGGEGARNIHLGSQLEAKLGEERGQQKGQGHLSQVLSDAVAWSFSEGEVPPGLGSKRCEIDSQEIQTYFGSELSSFKAGLPNLDLLT
jgi:hypothetical protein